MTSSGKNQVFEAQFNPAGYYYTKFTKSYHNVTGEELKVADKLAVELIADNQKVNEHYLFLDLKNTTYGYMSRTEVYYVKNAGPILGKLTMVVQDMGDEHYNLSLIFAEHRVVPKSAIRNALKARNKLTYKPFSVTEDEKVVNYRLKSRKWRHNRKKGNTSGDIKSDD